MSVMCPLCPQRLSGDLAAAAATEERKEDAIEQLQRRLAKQERKLHHVNSAIRRLQQTVSSATGQAGAGVTGVGRRRGDVTPRPFVSKYPAGECFGNAHLHFVTLDFSSFCFLPCCCVIGNTGVAGPDSANRILRMYAQAQWPLIPAPT